VEWEAIMENMALKPSHTKSLAWARICRPLARSWHRKFLDIQLRGVIIDIFSNCLPRRARYPPYSDRKGSLLSFLLRKRRPLPNLHLSHVVAIGLGVGLTFLANYYLQVRKV